MNRVVKKIYDYHRWSAKKEVKWTDLDDTSRLAFAQHAKTMVENNPSIKLFAITANKHKVQDHIRTDENKLFNYMVKLAFIDEISRYDQVILFPDERGIKVVTEKQMEEYLQTELIAYENSPSLLKVKPQDSQHNKTLQFSDYLAGLIQGNFQDNDTVPWDYLSANIVHKKLFF